MPPNPKRPHSRDLKFDEGEILRADDPRPQRVPQYPSGGTRRPLRKAEEAIPTTVYDTEKADEEMQAQYGAPEPQYRQAFLYVERGPGQGQLLEVKQGSVVIGRASVSDLRLQHPSISRRHAQVKRVGEQFFVRDLGSQNGTFVNKQRIANEVEVRPGDNIALGNALVRLRGPLQKGEKLPGLQEVRPKEQREVREKRVSTAVVARPPGAVTQPARSGNGLKIAIAAGAGGFVLATVLAFALVKATLGGPSAPAVDKKTGKATAAASSASSADRNKAIQDAIARKMKENEAAAAKAEAAQPAAEAEAEAAVEASAPVVVVRKEEKKAAPAPRPASPQVAKLALAAAKKPGSAAGKAADDAFGDDDDASAASGSPKKGAILAPYERGNAEGSLELAKKAGDKELVQKLTKFLQVYEAAQDAMMSNNGTAAIKNFTLALQLDEQLSSGWGKYGGEIRRQLGNLYTLVGMQYASTGDDDKAKKSWEAALKHDPSNARAKAQLAKVDGAASKPAARSADDAFDGDEPAAKKPKSRQQAIDDAFGD